MTLKNRVANMLVKFRETQASDNLLISYIWYNDIKGMGTFPENMTALELLKGLGRDEIKLSFSESICRWRRYWQELDSNTYGQNHDKTGMKQIKVKESLGY